MYLFDSDVTESNLGYWDNNFKIKHLELNQLQRTEFTEISKSAPLTRGALSCPRKSAGSGVSSLKSLIRPSAVLFPHWVEPIGPILIRLEPNHNPSVGNNLASGIPFQPVTLCRFDWPKEKELLRKQYSEILHLGHLLHLLYQVLFQCLSTFKERVGFFPRQCSFKTPYKLKRWWGFSLAVVKNAQERDKTAAIRITLSPLAALCEEVMFQREPRWYCPQRHKGKEVNENVLECQEETVA